MREGQLSYDAGKLVAFGLSPTLRPTRDAEYARLLQRHHDEQQFQEVFEQIASGLGLEVLDVSDFGVVLGTAIDSPFTLSVASYQGGLSTEHRLIHGLVQVGLAAYLYPRADDLEADSLVRRVSVVELDDFLRAQCRLLLERDAGIEIDVQAGHPELERALHIYLRWPATGRTSTGRVSTKTTRGVIVRAFERLAMHGHLRRVAPDGGGTFQALRRYRVQVRELATDRALQLLRSEEV